MIVPNVQLANYPRVEPRRSLPALVAAAETARQEAIAANDKLEAACLELEQAVLSRAGYAAPRPLEPDVELLNGHTLITVYPGELRPSIDWRTVEQTH